MFNIKTQYHNNTQSNPTGGVWIPINIGCIASDLEQTKLKLSSQQPNEVKRFFFYAVKKQLAKAVDSTDDIPNGQHVNIDATDAQSDVELQNNPTTSKFSNFNI